MAKKVEDATALAAPSSPALITSDGLIESTALMREILEKSQRLMMHLVQTKVNPQSFVADAFDPMNVGKSFQKLLTQMIAQSVNNPFRLVGAQLALWTQYNRLWENTLLRLYGCDVEPFFKPAKTDSRFRDESWQKYPLFDFLKQHYLLVAGWLHNVVSQVEFSAEDAKDAEKVNFYTRQLIDALSPSNFVATNPEVLLATLNSGGKNLLKGLNNLLADFERGKGEQLRITMTDISAFELGKSVACTAGKVVYQNELMQLVQYQPTTEQVYTRPILVVPPWINKFYILDLRPKNSFIKWAVDQGYTVFVISWINPDEKLSHKHFQDYMQDGILTALDVSGKITGQPEVNAVGYCLGGTLLASTLAYMAARQDTRIVSSTFFTTMLDFSDPGELGVFIDDEQVSSLEEKMSEKGYLEGSSMATTFNMLRANDLIWSFYVNNYLKGEDAKPFDILFWNSDSTRMPAVMHSFYLRNLYIRNLLKEPNGLTLSGVPIDLRNVQIPVCFVSTLEDHIAPWKSTYAGTQLFSGEVKFILGGSGHIAGIINPPVNNKYFYFTNPQVKTTPNCDEWLKNATQQPGSWWGAWEHWVRERSGELVPARIPGALSEFPALEDAPGSYVKVRLV